MSIIIRNNYTPSKSFLNDFFNDEFFNVRTKWTPSVNVKERETEFQVEVAAPGYTKDSFNVEIKDKYLHISSQNESSSEDKSDKYHRREFTSSSFERSFSLPENVDPENIKASYKDGVLLVLIPKKSKVQKKTRQIEIQ
jgi:HSP20 family protein